MNLLIVDDNYSDIFLAKEIIDEINEPPYNQLTIFEAEDGIAALNILKTTVIDIMLLDIKMPKMDGIELLKIIKEKYKNIYVIMLTTSDYEKDIIETQTLGADAYVIKPLEPDDFKKRIISIKSIYIEKYFEYVKYKK